MRRKLKEDLWEAYINAVNLTEQQKENIKELGSSYFDDVSFLYKIYALFENGDSSIEDQETGIVYEREGNLSIFRKGSIGIFLEMQEMKSLLADMIMLFEEILPLGTVVDLKKEELSKTIDLSKVEHFRVIITKRFLGAGKGCYYPYGAVVYPIGMSGTGKVISFTSPLIEEVVFTGYQDEVEEAYEYQMKYRLIIEEKRKSIGFATMQEKEEMEKLVEDLERKHG